MAGLPDPRTVNGSEGINGTSLMPAMVNPANTSIKTAAFSQFSKDNAPGDPNGGGTGVNPRFFRNETRLMGYTMRTDSWVGTP